MKRIILLSIALICAVSASVSCNKDNVDEEEPVNILGEWKYTGCDATSEDDLNFFDNYLFKIDGSGIKVYGMDKTTLKSEYSYTRDGNMIAFTPAFNGKYGSAKLSRTYGTGTESISWDCGKGQVYNFSRNN